MNNKTLLLLLFQLLSYFHLTAQVISSDTTDLNLNGKSFNLISHDEVIPPIYQFEFNDRLFFCSTLGAYERKQEGIEFIAGPIDNNFPYLIIEDNDNPNGYELIYGAYEDSDIDSYSTDVSLILLTSDISSGQILDTFSNGSLIFSEKEAPISQTPLTLERSFYPSTFPETSFISYASRFRINDIVISSVLSSLGEVFNPSITHFFTDIENNTDLGGNNISEIGLNSNITSATIINDIPYFYNGQIVKLENNSFEQVTNDFDAYCVGNWNDHLVLMGKNKMTISVDNFTIDLTDVLNQVKLAMGNEDHEPILKVDSHGHFWFGAATSDKTIELILDADIINDLNFNTDIDLNRFIITSDTTEFIEHDESFLIVRHEVRDLLTERSFVPQHFIDLNEELYVSSDIGYLRRQKDGLVPVLIPEDNSSIPYYLAESDNQLHPLDQYVLDFYDDGYNLKEIRNNSFSALYEDSLMLFKLMEIGDGRSFKLLNH